MVDGPAAHHGVDEFTGRVLGRALTRNPHLGGQRDVLAVGQDAADGLVVEQADIGARGDFHQQAVAGRNLHRVGGGDGDRLFGLIRLKAHGAAERGVEHGFEFVHREGLVAVGAQGVAHVLRLGRGDRAGQHKAVRCLARQRAFNGHAAQADFGVVIDDHAGRLAQHPGARGQAGEVQRVVFIQTYRVVAADIERDRGGGGAGRKVDQARGHGRQAVALGGRKLACRRQRGALGQHVVAKAQCRTQVAAAGKRIDLGRDGASGAFGHQAAIGHAYRQHGRAVLQNRGVHNAHAGLLVGRVNVVACSLGADQQGGSARSLAAHAGGHLHDHTGGALAVGKSGLARRQYATIKIAGLEF